MGWLSGNIWTNHWYQVYKPYLLSGPVSMSGSGGLDSGYKVHVNDAASFGPHWINRSQQNFNAGDILQQNDFRSAAPTRLCVCVLWLLVTVWVPVLVAQAASESLNFNYFHFRPKYWAAYTQSGSRPAANIKGPKTSNWIVKCILTSSSNGLGD